MVPVERALALSVVLPGARAAPAMVSAAVPANTVAKDGKSSSNPSCRHD